MGPEALAQVLRPLILQSAPPALLVGLQSADDAAVYQINEQQAIISTADYFPPIVDNPYAFGAIAAANALSDIYAMGGQPLMAINLVSWPADLEPALLSEILRGGAETVAGAGAVIAGGHTITDAEPKYGLAVTGIVHPQRIFTKGGAKPGDYLVLSKPLGTGIITTAHKEGIVEAADLDAAVQSMMRPNNHASQTLQQFRELGVHAVTDITGFGLLGHAWEMASQSGVGMRFQYDALPLLPHVKRYIEQGSITGGARRNEQYLRSHVTFHERLGRVEREILWDPQTSGGLFAAIDSSLWSDLAVCTLQEHGAQFWHVGEVTAAAGAGQPVLEVV
jgi:selenide,water dikinase